MRRFLNLIGSWFVYRSPELDDLSYLRMAPNRILREMAGTRSHLSKKELIERIKTQRSCLEEDSLNHQAD